MAFQIENYGLGFLTDTEEHFGNLMRYVISEGRQVQNYYGCPYYFKSFGNPEFWVGTGKDAEEGKRTVTDVFVHCGGNCIWDVYSTGFDLTPANGSRLSRTIMVARRDGGKGMVPVNIITAAVLPSYAEGEDLKLQVIGQPLEISYFEDEKEYIGSMQPNDRGERWALTEGHLFPLSFFSNHMEGRTLDGRAYESDSYVRFCGRVTTLAKGILELGGESHVTFVRCFIETEYGELELDHAYEQVPEELRHNIRIGSIVSGTCIIYGDAAIYEYEDGPVKDLDHDLRLLKSCFTNGRAERLRTVLAEDAVYTSDTTGKTFTGPDGIISNIDRVHATAEAKYYATLVKVTRTDNTPAENGSEQEAGSKLPFPEVPEYPAGTPGILLAFGAKECPESLALIDVNDEGLITRITLSRDRRYQLEIDERETRYVVPDILDFPDDLTMTVQGDIPEQDVDEC